MLVDANILIAYAVVIFVLLLLVFYILYKRLQEERQEKTNLLEPAICHNSIDPNNPNKIIDLLKEREQMFSPYFHGLNLCIYTAFIQMEQLLPSAAAHPMVLQSMSEIRNGLVDCLYDLRQLSVDAVNGKTKGLQLCKSLTQCFNRTEMDIQQLAACICMVRHGCKIHDPMIVKTADHMLQDLRRLRHSLIEGVCKENKKRNPGSSGNVVSKAMILGEKSCTLTDTEVDKVSGKDKSMLNN